jgi:hypothetical protein
MGFVLPAVGVGRQRDLQNRLLRFDKSVSHINDLRVLHGRLVQLRSTQGTQTVSKPANVRVAKRTGFVKGFARQLRYKVLILSHSFILPEIISAYHRCPGAYKVATSI